MNAVEVQRKSFEGSSLGANEVRALTESETQPSQHRDVLTISEVAANLRCSKAHVYNAINGRVTGVSALPAIAMGRRKLVSWRHGNRPTKGASEVVCFQSRLKFAPWTHQGEQPECESGFKKAV
jgi:hypothetical protein